MSDGAAFDRRTVAWIAGGAVTSFALALVLTAFADDLGDPVSAGSDSFSTSALGHRAAVELLRATGVDVHVRRSERPPPVGPGVPLLVVEPPLPPPPETRIVQGPSRLSRLLQQAAGLEAPVLVVLPKRQGLADVQRPRWIAEAGLLSPEVPGRVLREVLPEARPEVLPEVLPEGAGAGIRRLHGAGPGTPVRCGLAGGAGETFEVQVAGLQALEPAAGLEPVLTCDGATLVARAGAGDGAAPVLVLADPDVVGNHGLGRAGHAELLHALVTEVLDARSVVLDETLHGFTRSTGLLAELLRFPLVLVVAHGALVLSLVAWAGVARFGTPRPLARGAGEGKRVLIDNTAKLLGLGVPPAEALPAYAQQTIRAVAAHYSFPVDLDEPRVLARLAEIARARGVEGDPAALVVRARELAEAPRSRNEPAIRAALQLHHWREEMTRVV